MVISEIFHSVQGEGLLAGLPSVFIRTSGCNLRCNWCDTDYASWNPEGVEMKVSEIVKKVKEFDCPNIVITGGEPMIAPNIFDLADELYNLRFHITIETAGTVLPNNIRCHLASISPKTSNSTPDERLSENWRKRHERDRLNIGILKEWVENYNYQLKFVVSSDEDIVEINEIVEQIGSPLTADRVMLMPEGTTCEQLEEKTQIMLDLCRKYNYRYCDRLHIKLFGNEKGT